MSPADDLPRSARPLRVCHVVATAEGALWVCEQLRELRDRHGMEVTAIVTANRGRLVDHLRSEGIRFLVWDQDMSLGNPRDLGRNILGLARVFCAERFDVVQTHIFPTMMIGRLAAWLADVPMRAAMVSGPFHLQARTSRAIDRDTCFMEHVLIASCELTRRIYRETGVPDTRLALVYYGQDPARLDPRTVRPAGIREEMGWHRDTPVVGMVAIFYPRLGVHPWIPPELSGRGIKGHEDLLSAAEIILRERPDTKFLLVGGGWTEPGEAFRREVVEQARARGLTGSIAFTGFRADVPGVLRDVDVSVQASLSENLGGTLESLFLERPLVATRVGGMVDSVKDGETGILVEPQNPQDLARGILALLSDPARGRALGRAGRQLMLERFTLERTADELAALYHQRGQAPGYRRERRLARLTALAPLAAYMMGRLRNPENPLFHAWDRRRSQRTTA